MVKSYHPCFVFGRIRSDSLLLNAHRGEEGGIFPWGTTVETLGDHSPSSNAEVKNEWSCISTPTYDFMACGKTALLSPSCGFDTRM